MADRDRVRRWVLQHRDVYGVTGYWFDRIPEAPSRTAVPRTQPAKAPLTTVRETIAPSLSRQASRADAAAALDAIAREIRSCRACPLGATRLQAVPGEGNAAAEIMFVGEGPGYAEDHQGRPFVGKAGELLTKIIQAMGFTRENVFIANMVKCHPMKSPDPELRNNDRPPTEEEIRGCRSFLERQIAAVHPAIIVALGSVSSRALLATATPITALRGTFAPYPPDPSILVMPTFHPAALLRDPGLKKPVWEDMKAVLAKLGRTPPSRG